MPNLQSAKKALRQTKTRTARNRSYKNRVKNLGQEIMALLSTGKAQEAEGKLSLLYKAIDKAVKVEVLNKNTAARRKGLFARRIAQASTAVANNSTAK
ncbi:MAG: 30S ribosomal protein S20 [Candidatus Spechtbacterales bacterium]